MSICDGKIWVALGQGTKDVAPNRDDPNRYLDQFKYTAPNLSCILQRFQEWTVTYLCIKFMETHTEFYIYNWQVVFVLSSAVDIIQIKSVMGRASRAK